MKCLELDRTLEKATLFLRSAVDLPCIVHIIAQIIVAARPWRSQILGPRPRPRTRVRVKLVEHALQIPKPILWSYLLTDILAILPIPQVVILIILTRTTGSKSLNARRFLNSLVLLQYLPRAFRMYLYCKEANKTSDNENGYTIWLKVYKFILASHVFGAIWYFFSIQREMDCWNYACRSQSDCETKTFTCGGKQTFKNVTFLDNLCPVNTPNPTVFNFGIFLDAIQSGVLGSRNFPEKFLQCFWWGLRSLSSFGQNLQTSAYAWEILFALCISISGMLLFLIYLNAILQFATRRSEQLLRRKREKRTQEIAVWLSRKGLPEYAKEVIMEIVQEKLENGINVRVDNILSVLPSAHRDCINRYLRLAMLKKVPKLHNIDGKLLKAIDEHLSLERYTKDRCITREGKALDRLFIVTHGTVQTYRTNRKGEKFSAQLLEKGDSYGSELMYWASDFKPLDKFPISTRTVKPATGAEAFVLMASDLEKVCRRFWWHFFKGKELHQFSDNQLQKLKKFAALAMVKARRRKQAKKKHKIRSFDLAILGRVQMLQSIDVIVLKAIREILEPVDYTKDYCIIREGERLDMMLFITHGTVETYTTNDEGGRICERGIKIYGAEVVNWASKFSSFSDLPISTRMVTAVTNVEAFALSANDLKSVAIKYWWYFTKNKNLTDFSESLLEEFAVSSIQKAIHRRRQAKMKTYLQLPTTRTEMLFPTTRTKKLFPTTTSEKFRWKMKTKKLEVDLWLSRKGLPSNLKAVIMHNIQQKLEQNKDVQVENILSVLPSAHSIYIKRYLRLAALKKVPMVQTMGVRMLKAICVHLQPVDYLEDSCIIREGERLHKMIFITHGTVQTYKTNGKGGKMGSKFLEKGDFYGAEELLNWASKFSSFDDLPLSSRMVKPVTKVEAFALSAYDLRSISIKYWWNFTKNKDLSDFDQSMLEEFAATSIEKEIHRMRQAKKKRTIGSLNKLATNYQGSGSHKFQKVISKVMGDHLP